VRPIALWTDPSSLEGISEDTAYVCGDEKLSTAYIIYDLLYFYTVHNNILTDIIGYSFTISPYTLEGRRMVRSRYTNCLSLSSAVLGVMWRDRRGPL
jgi:hypothetical protein